jgi:hypothetical protein
MNDKIMIHPSSLDTWVQCPQQWYRVFILGGTSIPNSRAAIGTAIHRGVEEGWKDSIKAKTKIFSPSSMADAAVEAYEEEEQKGLVYGSGESQGTCIKEVITGLDTFVEDIAPWVIMPTHVERHFIVKIADHPIVEGISATVDYLEDNVGVIADLKTGKRKHNVANSSTQQSVYKIVTEANNIPVKISNIQSVVLKAKPEGHIMDAQINEPKAKAIFNILLDTLELLHQDKVDPNLLFRGNPKYYLCSPKYCAFFNECKFVGN